LPPSTQRPPCYNNFILIGMVMRKGQLCHAPAPVNEKTGAVFALSGMITKTEKGAVMATLTDQDFIKIQQHIKSDPEINNVFRSWGISKSQWRSLFQAAETWFTGSFNTTPTESFKAALDNVVTTTATQAKWVGKVWFAWRINITW